MATEKIKLGPGRMIFTAIYILIFPALILLLSGNWLWIEGWIFDVWFIALCGTVIIHLYRHDPALLEQANLSHYTQIVQHLMTHGSQRYLESCKKALYRLVR